MICRSGTPAEVSPSEGLIEAMVGGSFATTENPWVPESPPMGPAGSAMVMVYGPPGMMPLGQPRALVSLKGVDEAPEQVGTTAVMVLALTKATRRSGIEVGVELPLIGAVMVTVGAPPEKPLVAGAEKALLMVTT